jgi:hydroxypyruvate isomerase
MRFCANVSMLFTEVPFLERFGRAASAGFAAVELWWPAGEDVDAVAAAIAAAGLEVALLNFPAGDMPAGERGLLGDPAREAEFRDAVPRALDLAHAIGCTRLNALVGHRVEATGLEKQLTLAARNVAWAADLARERGADVLIEAINTFENGPYLVPTTADAVAFLDRVARENVKLQYDAYHMQRMEGNLVPTIREHVDRIGHIQIADAPDRGEPGTGEIDYGFVLRAIDGLGYDGFVGLEYRPRGGSTEESLGWLPRAARGGVVSANDLDL